MSDEFDQYLEDDDFDIAIFDAALNAAKKSSAYTQTQKNSTLTHHSIPQIHQTQPNHQSQIKYKQQTIFGATQVTEKPKRISQQTSTRRLINPTQNTITQTQLLPRVKPIKKWDRIQSIHSLARVISNGKHTSTLNKRKSKKSYDEEDQDDGILSDDSETERFLLAAQQADDQGAEIPMHLTYDPQEIKTWIYSINKPKRKYQYDIVAKALFNNCLVSLPTGLGKTFIAAVVMLNFYRWYPQGKILFLAPTKPLVQQQIEACHSIAGIPSRDCLTLTGSVAPAKRAKVWDQKRVVFSTPQTVMNDLTKGLLKPQDVICVVVDEAHRATGAYAYCVVIKSLMRFNPHFRVLALTATPGSDPERVQEVIDNLHIGHIEVRTEESMDIKPYTKHKEIVLEAIAVTPELASIRDKWATLMQPFIKQCDSLFRGSKDPALIHPYSITSAVTQLPQQRGYLRPNLLLLGKMSNIMAKLLEYSIPIAYEKMAELKHETSKVAKGLCSLVGYKSLLYDIEEMMKSPTFSPHPKMDKMKALIIEFFIGVSERQGGQEKEKQGTSRLMVFCNFRDVVSDIVDYLNLEQPLIKASAFIGQGTDTKGNRGMTQKQQAEVIRKFKADEFNVLVATSIGEEGLDIGALDCIICYEAQKSPLRMLQRLGRTGRNEDGKVIVLMSQGREELNWDKAKDQYQHVQNALLSKTVLELFDDCERLIPEGVRPVPVDKELDVQPYIAEEVELERVVVSKDKPTRKKRPGIEDLPPGARLGFVTGQDFQPIARSILDRAQAALLDKEQTEVLKSQWCRSVDPNCIPRPIDPDQMKIQYHPTATKLGKKLHSAHDLGGPRSRKFSAVIDRMKDLAHDEDVYHTWKTTMTEAFDENNVVWWPDELKGTGAKRPFRHCIGTGEVVRRTWNKFQSKKVDNSHPLSQIDVISPGDSQIGSASDEVHFPERLVLSPNLAQKSHRLDPDLDDDLPDLNEILEDHNATPKSDLHWSPDLAVSMNRPSDDQLQVDREMDHQESIQLDCASTSHSRSPVHDHASTKIPCGSPSGVPVKPTSQRAPTRVSEDEFDMSSDWDPMALAELDEIEQLHKVQPMNPPAIPSKSISSVLEMLPKTPLGMTKVTIGQKMKPIKLMEEDEEISGLGPPTRALSVNEVEKGGGEKKSRKGKEKAVEEEEEEMELRKKKNEKVKGVMKGKKRGHDWAYNNVLFDLEASQSDQSCSSGGEGKRKGNKNKRKKTKRRSSSEGEIPSENSIDRDFLVDRLSSSNQKKEKSMGSFYRASLLSQHPIAITKFHHSKPNQFNGKFKWDTPGKMNSKKDGLKTKGMIDVTPGAETHEDEEFSYDSFCVNDEDTVEYEEGADRTSEL
ncbi:hypothetical protein DFH28DRAFT_881844 [Melampsora americana]|nr:hypothetical protein DFH28DRAFT_881844 [Melampsora americana]